MGNVLKRYNGTSWEAVGGTITGDTLPIGSEVDFVGENVPAGWEEVDSYSTSETDTGKVWIDGKKIYRKVISDFTMPSATTKIIDSTLKNSYIDTLLSAQGSYTVTSNNYRRLIPWVDRSDVTAQIGFTITTNGAQLNCGANAAEGINGIMIVEYTKLS